MSWKAWVGLGGVKKGPIGKPRKKLSERFNNGGRKFQRAEKQKCPDVGKEDAPNVQSRDQNDRGDPGEEEGTRLGGKKRSSSPKSQRGVAEQKKGQGEIKKKKGKKGAQW